MTQVRYLLNAGLRRSLVSTRTEQTAESRLHDFALFLFSRKNFRSHQTPDRPLCTHPARHTARARARHRATGRTEGARGPETRQRSGRRRGPSAHSSLMLIRPASLSRARVRAAPVSDPSATPRPQTPRPGGGAPRSGSGSRSHSLHTDAVASGVAGAWTLRPLSALKRARAAARNAHGHGSCARSSVRAHSSRPKSQVGSRVRACAAFRARR